MRRVAALIPLAAAAAVFAYNKLPAGGELSPEAQRAREIMAEPLSRCTDQQRKQLAEFYGGTAKALPRLVKLVPGLDATKFRRVLELSARLYFDESFPKTPGLSASIHGPEGALAKLYGLEAGSLDTEKMSQALNAVADACAPNNPSVLHMLNDLIH